MLWYCAGACLWCGEEVFFAREIVCQGVRFIFIFGVVVDEGSNKGCGLVLGARDCSCLRLEVSRSIMPEFWITRRCPLIESDQITLGGVKDFEEFLN